MNRVLGSLDQKIEAWLYRRGFVIQGVRGLVKCQLYVSLMSSVGALILAPSWGGGFAAGALLMTLNFIFLARVIQELVYVRRGAVTALLFGFYLRLFMTGAALYLLIVWVGVSAVALLAGLTTVVVTILMWSVFIRGKT
jgi:hypothetical protein